MQLEQFTLSIEYFLYNTLKIDYLIFIRNLIIRNQYQDGQNYKKL